MTVQRGQPIDWMSRDRRWHRPGSGSAAAMVWACGASKSASRNFDGAVTIASAPGEGTTLAIHLPLPRRDDGGAACACCWLTITASCGED